MSQRRWGSRSLYVPLISSCLVIYVSLYSSWAEPYDNFGRRGRKEPEALAAASSKRLFVENQSYLVAGYCQHGLSNNVEPSGRGVCSKFFCSQHRLKTSFDDASNGILSIADKYKYMRDTFRKRLAFGRNSCFLSIQIRRNKITSLFCGKWTVTGMKNYPLRFYDEFSFRGCFGILL